MCKPVENILKHNGIKADNKMEYNIFLWVFWPIPILWLKQHAGSLRLPHFTWCVTRGSSSVRLELNSPRIFLRSVPLRETRKQEYLPAWAIVEFVIPSYTSRYKHEGCIFLGEQLSREGSASAPSAAPPVSQHALYFFVDVNILKFHKQALSVPWKDKHLNCPCPPDPPRHEQQQPPVPLLVAFTSRHTSLTPPPSPPWMRQIHLPRASAPGTPHYLRSRGGSCESSCWYTLGEGTTARYRQFLRSTRTFNPTLTSSVLSTSSIQQR